MNKHKVAIISIALVALTVSFQCFRIQEFPANWIIVSEEIERSHLYEKIGQPSGAAWDVKGDEFMKKDVFGVWFMRVYYDEAQVTREAWIYYRLGGHKHFKRIHLKHFKSLSSRELHV